MKRCHVAKDKEPCFLARSTHQVEVSSRTKVLRGYTWGIYGESGGKKVWRRSSAGCTERQHQPLLSLALQVCKQRSLAVRLLYPCFHSLFIMKTLLVASLLPYLAACFTIPVTPVALTTKSSTALQATNGVNGATEKKKVIVLGGDGFCGWPTSLYLSDQGHDIVIVDNLSRRNIDTELGCDSLTPIQPIEVRFLDDRSVSQDSIRC